MSVTYLKAGELGDAFDAHAERQARAQKLREDARAACDRREKRRARALFVLGVVFLPLTVVYAVGRLAWELHRNAGGH